MNENLKKRLLSLVWRAGGMLVVFLLNGILDILSSGTIDIPSAYVVFAGLIIGEITKYINSTYLQ